MSIVFFVNLKT